MFIDSRRWCVIDMDQCDPGQIRVQQVAPGNGAPSAPVVVGCIAAQPVAFRSVLHATALQFVIALYLGLREQVPGLNMGSEVCLPE